MLEKQIYLQRKATIVGIDEAGRGCLAGPVTVGAAVFPQRVFVSKDLPSELQGLGDSKKLSPQRRELYNGLVRKWGLFAQTVFISNRCIDRININKAIELGIFYLVCRLKKQGFGQLYLLVDGNYRFAWLKEKFPSLCYESIIKGDETIFSIGAASILAKVSRDRRMQALARLFPGYYWEKNKGYPTQTHRSQIQKLGITPLHRKSYSL